MLICTNCRIEMRCVQNGLAADFGRGHVYLGDLYVCPECGARVMKTNDRAIHDPAHLYATDYLLMKTVGEVVY